MKNRVLAFNYTLKDKDGKVLDSSTEGPLATIEGQGQIIPALESQIKNMKAGEKKVVNLKAIDAYGIPQPEMIIEVPKKEVEHLKAEVGSFLQLQMGEEVRVVRITAITDEKVTLDANHPLAGVDLEFTIEMVESRDATEEEIAHGHVHGAHGHQH